jgi:hypothetical protein
MSGKIDQSSNLAGEIPAIAAAMESEDHSMTSSSTMANQTMVKKEIPTLHEYWKAPTVTDEDIVAYHFRFSYHRSY